MGTIAKSIPLFEDHERFLRKISIDSRTDCWNWTAGKTSLGYGVFSIKHSSYRAHRVSWAIFNGSLSSGLVLDHKCKNRMCINPDHLREVTRKVNTLENSNGPAYLNSIKTHCRNGHALTPDNLTSNKNERVCLTCNRISDAKRQREKRKKNKENASVTTNNH